MARKKRFSLHMDVPLPKEPPKPEPEPAPVPTPEPVVAPPESFPESVEIYTPTPMVPEELPFWKIDYGGTIKSDTINAPKDHCTCGHPKRYHGALHGNIQNMRACKLVNCPCRNYKEAL